MKWNFGKIYKEIRVAKGLTQAQICGNQLSRTSLAKIEACQCIPSIEHMTFLLNQINMSLEEFRYICNVYQPSMRQTIMDLAQNHISITGTKELEKIHKLCQQYLKENHDIPIQHIYDMLTVIIHLRKHGPDSYDDNFLAIQKKIWSFLEREDNWYFTDFQLLNTILFTLPIEALNFVSENLFNRIEKYKNYTDIKPLKKKLLTNLSTIYLYNGDKVKCEQITLEMLALAKELKRYDSLGFAQVRLGICRGDEDLIERGMALLRLTEEADLLALLTEEIKNNR